jgi:aspartyl-tRNA(Asn)/glutamyl-tRNA(Gln) amidotransferase subunit B
MARDLTQVSDRDALAEVIEGVIEANSTAVESFRSGGEDKVVGFLIGQVMRETRGKADPRLVAELIRERLRP